MNARKSRLRRRARRLAHAAGETFEPPNPPELVQRIRNVRDLRLADNGRRRREDLTTLEEYYGAERRHIWGEYHALMQAIRDGVRIEIPEPRIVEELPSKVERFTWFARIFRRRRLEAPLPEIVS